MAEIRSLSFGLLILLRVKTPENILLKNHFNFYSVKNNFQFRSTKSSSDNILLIRRFYFSTDFHSIIFCAEFLSETDFHSIIFCAEFLSETSRDQPIVWSKFEDHFPSLTQPYALASIDRASKNNGTWLCQTLTD